MVVTTLCILAVSTLPLPSNAAADSSYFSTVLSDYVSKPHESTYKLRLEGNWSGGSYRVYAMTSQVWKGVEWKHHLSIVVPDGLPETGRNALFFVDGGSWKDRYEGEVTKKELRKFKSRLRFYGLVASKLNAPLVIIRQVPHQKIWGMKEDALIAYSFNQFLETGDSDWPLLVPMVNSVVRAMDVAQEVLKRDWALSIDQFFVFGASKRGWTTWLTSKVDKRVVALVPMVIDMLNMQPQMAHQKAVWGKYSPNIEDYTAFDLPQCLESDKCDALRSIVDPYEYRASITQPKLIILGTNDPYWPVDALNLYWDGLVGPKYILYLPGQGHKAAKEVRRMVASINALYQHIERNIPLPQLSWLFTEDDSNLKIEVTSDIRPYRIKLWQASSSLRDFREVKWRGTDVCKSSIFGWRRIFGVTSCKLNEKTSVLLSQDVCSAQYIEMYFKHDDIASYSLTTTISVTGPDRCLKTDLQAGAK